ncbi:cupin domain-containing protein [Bradyrhizobium diazoefficiens]
MTIEHAAVEIARKPWGRVDLRPWSSIDASADPVGELRLGRIDKRAPSPALLLKLLFTSQPLSIQVHPNDEFAHAIGLPNGKTEAWYILSAPAGRAGCAGVEAETHAAGIARGNQGRLDCGPCAMASCRARRRHLRSRRHDPRHRRQYRARRDSAAERYDIPSVRFWPAARAA